MTEPTHYILLHKDGPVTAPTDDKIRKLDLEIKSLFKKSLEGMSASISDDDWPSTVTIYLFSNPNQQVVSRAVSIVQKEFPELTLDGVYPMSDNRRGTIDEMF